LGALLGPSKIYSVVGLMFTFALIPVYSVANFGVYRLYRREHPEEFRPLLHVVIPVLATVALIWVGVKSLSPAPSYPNNWAFPLVVAWFVIGLVVLGVMSARGREAFLLKAGQEVHERVERSEERRETII
jgi:amino acid transporter